MFITCITILDYCVTEHFRCIQGNKVGQRIGGAPSTESDTDEVDEEGE